MVFFKFMNALSISLTCCNRPQYLKTVLDSLVEADKTGIDVLLNISVDKADSKVIDIVKSFDALPVGNLEINEPKLGCNKNTLKAILLARSTNHSPYILHLEDDTVLSKDALQFFIYAFRKYEKETKIISIGGYNKTEEMDESQIYNIFSETFFSAWGCGFWDSKIDIIIENWTKSNSNSGMSWDSYLSNNLFETQKYHQVRPAISRIQNIGAEKGTWVMDPTWHYYNHRSPFLSDNYDGTIEWIEYAKNNQ
jgi:hypothetical protein